MGTACRARTVRNKDRWQTPPGRSFDSVKWTKRATCVIQAKSARALPFRSRRWRAITAIVRPSACILSRRGMPHPPFIPIHPKVIPISSQASSQCHPNLIPIAISKQRILVGFAPDMLGTAAEGRKAIRAAEGRGPGLAVASRHSSASVVFMHETLYTLFVRPCQARRFGSVWHSHSWFCGGCPR